MTNFRKELEAQLNKNSMENGSNTPDFILANYLMGCLVNFNEAVNRREQWYGREEIEEERKKLREEREKIKQDKSKR